MHSLLPLKQGLREPTYPLFYRLTFDNGHYLPFGNYHNIKAVILMLGFPCPTVHYPAFERFYIPFTLPVFAVPFLLRERIQQSLGNSSLFPSYFLYTLSLSAHTINKPSVILGLREHPEGW